MSMTDDTRDDESPAVEPLDESFIEPGPRRSTYTPPPQPNVAAAAVAVGADPETIAAEAAAAAGAQHDADPEPAPGVYPDSSTGTIDPVDDSIPQTAAPEEPISEIPVWGGATAQPAPSSVRNGEPEPEPEFGNTAEPEAAPETREHTPLESFIATSTDASAAPPVYALDDVPLVDDNPPPLYFSAPPLDDVSLDSFPPPAAFPETSEVVYDLSASDYPATPAATEPLSSDVSEDARADSAQDEAPRADSTAEGFPADDFPADDFAAAPPPSFGSGQLPPPPFDTEQPPPPRAEEQLPAPGEYPPAPVSPTEYPSGQDAFAATPFDNNTYVMPPLVQSPVEAPAEPVATPDALPTDAGLADAGPADAGPATFEQSPTAVPSLSDLPGPGMAPPPSFDSPEAQAAFLANHAAPAGRPWIPERRSMSDDDLAAALSGPASSPDQRLDAMEELERQMNLREVEAREYSDWENSMLSVGTPEAIAAVEQLRPQFQDIVPVTMSIPVITPEIAAAFESERAATAQASASGVQYEAPQYEAPQYEAPQYEAPQYEAPQYDAQPAPTAPAWMPPPPSEPSIFAQPYADQNSADQNSADQNSVELSSADESNAARFGAAPENEPGKYIPVSEVSEVPEPTPEPDFADVERTISFDELFGVTAARVVPADDRPQPTPEDLPPAPAPTDDAAPVAVQPVEPVFEPFADPFFGRTASENAAATDPQAPAVPDDQLSTDQPSTDQPSDQPAAPAFSWIIDPSAHAAPDSTPYAAAEPSPEPSPEPGPEPIHEYSAAPAPEAGFDQSPVPTPPPLVEPPAFASAFETVVPSSSYPAPPVAESEALPAGLAFAEAAAVVAPEPLPEAFVPDLPSAPEPDADPAANTDTGALAPGSFAAILGDTDIDLQRPVEPIPVAPETAATSAATAVRSRPRAVPIFVPEESGLEPTPTDRRVGRAARQFWLWFAANSSVVSLGFGGVLFSLGMSLRQAVIATLAGVVLSFIPLGLGTLAGKRSGQPTMVVSRATFGVQGNILPAVISIVSRVFWGATLLWVLAAAVAATLVGAGASGGLSEAQLVILGLAVGFLVALVIAFFGYGLLARFQLVVSIVSAVLVVGLIALTVDKIDVAQALTVPDGPLSLVLTGAVLVFSFVGLVWANSSSDLARYQRPGSSSGSSMLWATFGTTLPTFGLISYGALLAASDPQIAAGLASNPLDTLGRMLPTWYPVPLIAATALSLLSGVVISIYSGGFAVQAAGLRIKRQWSVLIVGVLLVVVAWVLSTLVGDLTVVFRDLATTLAVPVAAWAGIFAAETMIRNRSYDTASLLASGGLYPRVRVVNFVGLVVITVIGYALTTATLGWLSWQGFGLEILGIPLGSDLAASDFGVLVALVLGLVLPLAAGIPAIRRQEAAAAGATASVPVAVVGTADAAPVEPAAVEPAPVEPAFVEAQEPVGAVDALDPVEAPVLLDAPELVEVNTPAESGAQPAGFVSEFPAFGQDSSQPSAVDAPSPATTSDPLAHLLAEPAASSPAEPAPFAFGESGSSPITAPTTPPASPAQPN